MHEPSSFPAMNPFNLVSDKRLRTELSESWNTHSGFNCGMERHIILPFSHPISSMFSARNDIALTAEFFPGNFNFVITDLECRLTSETVPFSPPTAKTLSSKSTSSSRSSIR